MSVYKPTEEEIVAKYMSLRRQDRSYLPTWKNLTDLQRAVAMSEISTVLRFECKACGDIYSSRHQDGRPCKS